MLLLGGITLQQRAGTPQDDYVKGLRLRGSCTCSLLILVISRPNYVTKHLLLTLRSSNLDLSKGARGGSWFQAVGRKSMKIMCKRDCLCCLLLLQALGVTCIGHFLKKSFSGNARARASWRYSGKEKLETLCSGYGQEMFGWIILCSPQDTVSWCRFVLWNLQVASGIGHSLGGCGLLPASEWNQWCIAMATTCKRYIKRCTSKRNMKKRC